MILVRSLLTAALIFSQAGCKQSEDEAAREEGRVWPVSPDGFTWPKADEYPLSFIMVSANQLDEDVQAAVSVLRSQYSPDTVTFTRTELNGDQHPEIIVLASSYGFSPDYEILSRTTGEYVSVGRVSGDKIFLSAPKNGWRQLDAFGGHWHTRLLMTFSGSAYDFSRLERYDSNSERINVKLPEQAEQAVPPKSDRAGG